MPSPAPPITPIVNASDPVDSARIKEGRSLDVVAACQIRPLRWRVASYFYFTQVGGRLFGENRID